MTTNILQLLESKRCNGDGGACADKMIINSLKKRQISLCEIADESHQILNGHVVLGFTRCGLYLISYLCEVSSAPPEPEYHYSLYWWKFDLNKTLTLSHCYELFSDEHLVVEVHLIVAQSADLQSMVVLGCRLPCTIDDHRPCYVSILQRPELPTRECIVHFKFDLLPPFPCFNPIISLKMNNCVLLNTGDSLVCVNYMVNSSPVVNPRQTSNHSSPSTNNSNGISSYCQCFSLKSPHIMDFTTSSSPSHLLPIDIRYNGQIMVPISADCAHNFADSAELSVQMRQSRFDVELWLNTMLQRELDCRGYTFSSLNDYDLQLVEVCAENKEIVFLIAIAIEAYHHLTLSSGCYFLKVIGSWKTFTNDVTTIEVSKPTPISPLNSKSIWTDTQRLALMLRKRCSIPTTQHNSINAYSNHTVYTGKSLQALSHPILPVTLVLKKSGRVNVINNA